MLCPEPECLCLMTWGAEGAPAKLVPDDAKIGRLRRKVQAGSRR